MRGRGRRVPIGALLACLALGQTSCGPPTTAKPNVLLILVDDLGVGDLGVDGSADAHTPRIDQVAREGARFTRHYADSSCQPSRAALLTGLYPSRLGFRPRGRGIPSEVTTLAELLRERGYATQHLGKWHLGGTGIWGLDASPAAALPSAQGFDHWFGFLDSLLLGGPEASASGRISYRAGRYLRPWLVGSDAPAAYYEGHLTDLLTDRAVEFIRTSPERPWFLNLWYLAPHAPVQPHPRYLDSEAATPAGRYRALVRQLDDSVGRVLAALSASGQADRTLVVLLSDNGATTRFDRASNGPFFGKKVEYREGGIRTPLLMRWPGHIAPGMVIEAPVSILDLFPTIAALTGPPVDDRDGRDMGPLLRGGSLPGRMLFWDQTRPGTPPYYSVLSEDGRFRLIRWAGEPILLDLEADPSGTTDVHTDHPDVVGRLEERFRRWRREVTRVGVELRTDTRGHGLATGQDFQRSPGWGGFTFGIGVVPEPEPRGSDSQEEETIALQQGLWELTRTSRNALRLRMGSVVLEGRKLARGRCNAVVVTGQFVTSAREPKHDRSSLALFLDGALQQRRSGPLPPRVDLSQPTLLGLASGRRTDLAGRLGAPVFLNAHVVEKDDGSEQTAAELSAELCPPAR